MFYNAHIGIVWDGILVDAAASHSVNVV